MSNILILKKDLEHEQVENETLIFDHENEKVVVLNEAAAALWDLMEAENEYDELLDKYYDLFDSEKPPYREFLKDFDRIMSHFAVNELIEAYQDSKNILLAHMEKEAV